MNVKTVAVCLVVFGALVSVPLLRAQDMVKVALKNTGWMKTTRSSFSTVF
jgi:hypothetical protein